MTKDITMYSVASAMIGITDIVLHFKLMKTVTVLGIVKMCSL